MNEVEKNNQTTVKLWEVVHKVRIHDLLLQEVLLIEEEDDRGVLKPRICDDGPEQSFALLHTILNIRGVES